MWYSLFSLFKKRGQSLFYVDLNEMAENNLNKMKDYLTRFWGYYNSHPRFQKILNGS